MKHTKQTTAKTISYNTPEGFLKVTRKANGKCIAILPMGVKGRYLKRLANTLKA